MSKKWSLAIALLIAVMWTISTILDAISQAYEPRPEIGPLMVAVAAFAFANGTLGRKTGKEEE